MQKEWLFAEKLRYDLSNVTAQWARPKFIIKRKVAVFEAPIPTLDRGETNSSLSKDSIKFPVPLWLSSSANKEMSSCIFVHDSRFWSVTTLKFLQNNV
jgi:hypothetical protein